MLQPQLTAQQAVVQYGPFELEGFMLPSGEFRQSLRSTARAVGMTWGGKTGRLIQDFASKEALSPGKSPVAAGDLGEKSQNQSPGIVPVSTGFSGFSGQALTLDLTTANAFWAHVAMNASRDDYRQNAVNLLAAGNKITLEQAYCEAFGIAKDGRTISDQVLDAWLDLDNMTRRRLSSPAPTLINSSWRASKMPDLTLAQQELLFRANQERMEYAPDLPLTWEDLEDVINTEKFWFGYSCLEAELEKV